jgi:ABC-2 type transport system permease protein
MNRLLYIARFEYWRQLRRRGFLIMTFGAPLLPLVAIAVVIAIFVLSDRPERAIGYVDEIGVVHPDAALPPDDGAQPIPLRAYADEAEARAAYAGGQIDAYAVLPPEYLDTGAVRVYGRGGLSEAGDDSLRALLRGSLLAGRPAQERARAADPLAGLRYATPGGDELTRGQSALLYVFPFIFGLLFVFVTFSTSSYLLQAVVEEKENRTMEIVLTSVTPRQLLGGKVLGLAGLGLTLALVWVLYATLLFAVGAAFFPALRGLGLPLEVPLLALVLFVPGYLLFAALQVGIGAMVTSAQEGQQIASVVSLLAMLPFMLNWAISTNPDGLLAVGLSLFPLSAPLALMLRTPFTAVPIWQVALSVALLVASTALAIAAAARIFRVGMLQYGKRLRVREVWRALTADR